mmetsp:Transcript_6034/g.13284  ORF Transcript_6034/g.13284 Transcript_6034/m.13284 type:complete len:94 (-) Transcript_6034:195-476(-)
MVRVHRVKIESNFATLTMAIVVVEGLGRQLDPHISLIQEAAPFVLTTADTRAAVADGFRVRVIKYVRGLTSPITDMVDLGCALGFFGIPEFST